MGKDAAANRVSMETRLKNLKMAKTGSMKPTASVTTAPASAAVPAPAPAARAQPSLRMRTSRAPQSSTDAAIMKRTLEKHDKLKAENTELK